MPEEPLPNIPTKATGRRWRFAGVLAASLLLAVAQPLTTGIVREESSFDVLSSLLIVAVMLLVFEEREHRRIAFSLGMAAFLGIWLGHATEGPTRRILLVAAQLLSASFFTFALYGILRAILIKRVSGDAIFGAVCGYLLLGIIWSLLFYAVETASPGSFVNSSSGGNSPAATQLNRGDLSYYSFITLATVGYGDVTPTSPLARTLAWTEAITGQFYLAILVAGLVGFKVTQAMKS